MLAWTKCPTKSQVAGGLRRHNAGVMEFGEWLMTSWHWHTFHITGSMWREPTGCGPLTMPQHWCFRCPRPQQTVEQTVDYREIWDVMTLDHVTSLSRKSWISPVVWAELYAGKRWRTVRDVLSHQALIIGATGNAVNALQWHHMAVKASQITRNDCLLNRLFKLTTTKTSRLCITGYLWGESTVYRWVSLTKDSNKESLSCCCHAQEISISNNAI